MVFTGDEFVEGASFILETLKEYDVKASFFLTGNSYDPKNSEMLDRIIGDGHYLGAHSDKHLLYCDWEKRDSLLVSKEQFEADLLANYRKMEQWGVGLKEAKYFMPPYEWYNREIVEWASELGIKLVNFTPGLRTAADYTYPEMGSRYVSSEAIYRSLLDYERTSASGLNGFIILVHLGTDPRREDKFYDKLPAVLTQILAKRYSFERIDKFLP